MVEDQFESDIQTKGNILNQLFAEECTPLRNGIVLHVRLKSLDFKQIEILQIIRALNISKANGYDDIPLE